MHIKHKNSHFEIGKKILLVTLIGVITACSEHETSVETTAVIQANATVDTVVQQSQESTVTCEPLHGMTPYCGFKNPEDLIPVPGGEKLLVSEMGEFLLDSPGTLSLFDIKNGVREDLVINWQRSGDVWGDKTCEVPNQSLFSPHGIDFLTRVDGKHQLLVVNHGGREAVEFFELVNIKGYWQLDWKGCALPPEDPFINDVAALNDGGFFVTHMWNKSPPFAETVARLTAGEKTGWVWEWQAETGFTKVPGSQQMMPNGITVSRDANNSKLFVNIYMGSKTIKIDRASGKVEAAFNVQQPDNITIDDDGNLWVASHQHDPIAQTCNAVKTGPCLLPFEIVKANSDTMEAEVVLRHDGQPMGYSTVALNFAGKIYLGSAHGDRIVSVDLK